MIVISYFTPPIDTFSLWFFNSCPLIVVLHRVLYIIYLVLPRTVKLSCILKHSAFASCVSVTRKKYRNNFEFTIALNALLQTLLRYYRYFKASSIEFANNFPGVSYSLCYETIVTLFIAFCPRVYLLWYYDYKYYFFYY